MMETIKVAFDIDGTLRCNCEPTCQEKNADIVELLRFFSEMKNTEVYAWSEDGKTYAESFVRQHRLPVKVKNCISKIGAPKMDIAINDQSQPALADKNLIVRMR